jgi:hypothetical protein
MEGVFCIKPAEDALNTGTAFTLGVVVAFYDNIIVLQAL